MAMLPKRNGIAFVEILIVITLISILALASGTLLKGNDAKARDAQRMVDMELLSKAVKAYFSDTGEVPNSIPNDLNKAVDLERKLEDLYIVEIPGDPLPAADSYRYVYYLQIQYGTVPSHTFEFNTRLESPLNDTKESGDGGNKTDIYETGTGASVLGDAQEIGIAVPTTCTSIQWGSTGAGIGGCAGAGGGLTCTAVPQCNGLDADICVINGIIVGGPDDGEPYTGILNGGNEDQVIVGTAGNDIINGGNAKDTLCGLGGNDFMYGQNGKDFIDGGDGYDTLNGDSSPDICINGELLIGCTNE